MKAPRAGLTLSVATSTVALLAGCQAATGGLPDGSYAGSNQANQAVTVIVSGGRVVSFDQLVVGRGLHNSYRVYSTTYKRRLPLASIKCRSAFHDQELFCSVRVTRDYPAAGLTVSGHSETVELMKL